MKLYEAVDVYENIVPLEDRLLHLVCHSCGNIVEGKDVDESKIPTHCECGEEFTPVTCNECQTCAICSKDFDTWEDAYVIGDNLICEDCFSKIAEEKKIMDTGKN